jgi:Lrp/AsnC family transcriptional regulator for asnA, asnC and gidA
MAYSAIATSKISNTMVHQRSIGWWSRVITGIKPIINEKKIGYDWGAFTGITLNKDEDSSRVINWKNSWSNWVLFHNGFFYLVHKMIARPWAHRKLFMKKLMSFKELLKQILWLSWVAPSKKHKSLINNLFWC